VQYNQPQYALPPPAPDAGAMQALMTMLEAHWQDFTKLWADGIAIRNTAEMVAAAVPAAGTTSFYQDLKSVGKTVAHGIGTAAQWTGEKLGELGKYGKGGLEAFRKGGLQAMVEQFEGFQPNLYEDATGHSVGYGHFLKKGDPDFSGGITKAQAHAMSQKDVATARATVLRQTQGIKLNENQLDALTDFVYGVGSLVTKDKQGRNVDRTILTDLKAGDFAKVSKDFMMYSGYHDKAGNFKQSAPLYDRHLAESMLFSGQAGGAEQAGNTMNQQTTINVHGVQEPAAVAARLKSEQGRVNSEAMRNMSPRTG
jgi:GH24 family phage-related lysozyme (muramidase)